MRRRLGVDSKHDGTVCPSLNHEPGGRLHPLIAGTAGTVGLARPGLEGREDLGRVGNLDASFAASIHPRPLPTTSSCQPVTDVIVQQITPDPFSGGAVLRRPQRRRRKK